MRRVAVYKLIPDETLTLSGGAINVNGFKSLAAEEGWNGPLFAAVGERYGFDLNTPVCDFTPEQREILLYGSGAEKYHIIRYFDGAV